MGDVVVPLLGAVLGYMQPRHGEQGAHDELATDSLAEHGGAPDVSDDRVTGEGGVSRRGEVVQQLEIEQVDGRF